MPKYCLFCCKVALYACSCCGKADYCSIECLKADREVHKHEVRPINNGIHFDAMEDSTGEVKQSTKEGPIRFELKGNQDKLIRQFQDSMIISEGAIDKLKKKSTNTNPKDDAQHKKNLDKISEPLFVKKKNQRNRFNNEVNTMINNLNSSNISIHPKITKLFVINDLTREKIGILFRMEDILSIKYVAAFMSSDQKLTDDYRQYEKLVDTTRDGIAHELIFGDIISMDKVKETQNDILDRERRDQTSLHIWGLVCDMTNQIYAEKMGTKSNINMSMIPEGEKKTRGRPRKKLDRNEAKKCEKQAADTRETLYENAQLNNASPEQKNVMEKVWIFAGNAVRGENAEDRIDDDAQEMLENKTGFVSNWSLWFKILIGCIFAAGLYYYAMGSAACFSTFTGQMNVNNVTMTELNTTMTGVRTEIIGQEVIDDTNRTRHVDSSLDQVTLILEKLLEIGGKLSKTVLGEVKKKIELLTATPSGTGVQTRAQGMAIDFYPRLYALEIEKYKASDLLPAAKKGFIDLARVIIEQSEAALKYGINSPAGRAAMEHVSRIRSTMGDTVVAGIPYHSETLAVLKESVLFLASVHFSLKKFGRNQSDVLVDMSNGLLQNISNVSQMQIYAGELQFETPLYASLLKPFGLSYVVNNFTDAYVDYTTLGRRFVDSGFLLGGHAVKEFWQIIPGNITTDNCIQMAVQSGSSTIKLLYYISCGMVALHWGKKIVTYPFSRDPINAVIDQLGEQPELQDAPPRFGPINLYSAVQYLGAAALIIELSNPELFMSYLAGLGLLITSGGGGVLAIKFFLDAVKRCQGDESTTGPDALDMEALTGPSTEALTEALMPGGDILTTIASSIMGKLFKDVFYTLIKNHIVLLLTKCGWELLKKVTQPIVGLYNLVDKYTQKVGLPAGVALLGLVAVSMSVSRSNMDLTLALDPVSYVVGPLRTSPIQNNFAELNQISTSLIEIQRGFNEHNYAGHISPQINHFVETYDQSMLFYEYLMETRNLETVGTDAAIIKMTAFVVGILKLMKKLKGLEDFATPGFVGQLNSQVMYPSILTLPGNATI